MIQVGQLLMSAFAHRILIWIELDPSSADRGSEWKREKKLLTQACSLVQVTLNPLDTNVKSG